MAKKVKNTYRPTEIVEVTGNTSSHGFPIGTNIQLITITNAAVRMWRASGPSGMYSIRESEFKKVARSKELIESELQEAKDNIAQYESELEFLKMSETDVIDPIEFHSWNLSKQLANAKNEKERLKIITKTLSKF